MKMVTKEEKPNEETDEEAAGKDEAYQIFSAISYAVILFVIGMPLWWKATEVYRVALPYSEISALDDLEVKFVTNISIATLDTHRGEKLVDDLQNIFKISKLFQITFLNTPTDKKLLASVKTMDDLENASFHPENAGDLLLLEVPGLTRFSSSQVLVGNKRTVYFSSDTSAIKLSEVLTQWLLQEESLQRLRDAMTSPTLIDQDRAGRRRVPAAKQYDIMVTAVNPDPEVIDLQLDLKRAIQEYMSPLLSRLSLLADFTVKSQWLYYVTLEVEPRLVTQAGAAGQHYALAEEMLPHIITPLEKKLASHVSANPCINFVVYVPPCRQAPLHIYRRQGMRLGAAAGGGGGGGLDAFLSPRWGGIAIHNPAGAVCRDQAVAEPKPVEADVAAIMGVFLAQLRLLVGVQELEQLPIVKASLLPLTSDSVRRWELDSLLRTRTLEQTTSAVLTLQSLAQLLAEISNIVINDVVGASIFKAVSSVEEASELLKAGRLEAAFNASKEAFLSAEAAFTHPSLLALLYFPDDQKYAVYIPLFLPVMIPVLLSMKQVRVWISGKLNSQAKVKTD